MTNPLALSCIKLVGEHLRTAWSNGEDRIAREGDDASRVLEG